MNKKFKICTGVFKPTGKKVEEKWFTLSIPSFGQKSDNGVDIVDEHKCDECGNITTKHKTDSRNNLCRKRTRRFLK